MSSLSKYVETRNLLKVAITDNAEWKGWHSRLYKLELPAGVAADEELLWAVLRYGQWKWCEIGYGARVIDILAADDDAGKGSYKPIENSFLSLRHIFASHREASWETMRNMSTLSVQYIKNNLTLVRTSIAEVGGAHQWQVVELRTARVPSLCHVRRGHPETVWFRNVVRRLQREKTYSVNEITVKLRTENRTYWDALNEQTKGLGKSWTKKIKKVFDAEFTRQSGNDFDSTVVLHENWQSEPAEEIAPAITKEAKKTRLRLPGSPWSGPPWVPLLTKLGPA